MKRITTLVVTVVAVAGVVVFSAPAPGHAEGESAPYVTEIPQGYRDWRWISSAHEAGNLNSLGAVLGNDVAINAYREGKLPYPDGTIIVALHYHHVASDENNKVFGQELTELRRRINATKWPERETVTDATQGVQLATIRRWRAIGRQSMTGARSRQN
jgi:hypothetical protein